MTLVLQVLPNTCKLKLPSPSCLQPFVTVAPTVPYGQHCSIITTQKTSLSGSKFVYVEILSGIQKWNVWETLGLQTHELPQMNILYSNFIQSRWLTNIKHKMTEST